MLKTLKKKLKHPLSCALYSLYAWLAVDLTLHNKQGPLLVIAPHPDDESFGCGALIAAHVNRNEPVHILIVTDGGNSIKLPKKKKEQLIQTRQKETYNAAKQLGLMPDSVTFLNYQDGDAQKNIEAISKDIAQHIQLVEPTIISAPFMKDQHADHIAITEATTLALQNIKTKIPVLFYPMWFWPTLALHAIVSGPRYRIHALDARPYLNQKEAAIRCHKSQIDGVDGWGKLDPHLIKMQLRSSELYFTLSDSEAKE